MKAGDERTGHYDVVENWWTGAPNHGDEWSWEQVAYGAVDNPARIIVVTRGDWPADRSQPRRGRPLPTHFVVVADGNGKSSSSGCSVADWYRRTEAGFRN